MRAGVLIVATIAAVGAAGCSSGHHTSSPTTSPPPVVTTTLPATSVAPSTTDPSVNPDVIPPVITAAYVDAVFKVLNHIDGNATRSLLAQRSVTPNVIADIKAVYGGPLYSEELRIAEQSLQGNLRNVRQPPGDVTTVVTQLFTAIPSCIFASTQSDFSAVLVHPGAQSASEYYRLSLKDRTSDPSHLNPTPWTLTFNADYPTPTSIPSQCARS